MHISLSGESGRGGEEGKGICQAGVRGVKAGVKSQGERGSRAPGLNRGRRSMRPSPPPPSPPARAWPVRNAGPGPPLPRVHSTKHVRMYVSGRGWYEGRNKGKRVGKESVRGHERDTEGGKREVGQQDEGRLKSRVQGIQGGLWKRADRVERRVHRMPRGEIMEGEEVGVGAGVATDGTGTNGVPEDVRRLLQRT